VALHLGTERNARRRVLFVEPREDADVACTIPFELSVSVKYLISYLEISERRQQLNSTRWSAYTSATMPTIDSFSFRGTDFEVSRLLSLILRLKVFLSRLAICLARVKFFLLKRFLGAKLSQDLPDRFSLYFPQMVSIFRL